MTMKTKKALVWYGIFMIASILNQTKSFKEDFVVAGVVYCLWAVLLIITFMYFKETKWED